MPRHEHDDDLLDLRELIVQEISRIAEVRGKLQKGKVLALDFTSNDLFLLFEEEKDRLLVQLERIDSALAHNENFAVDPVQYARYVQLRRRALALSGKLPLH